METLFRLYFLSLMVGLPVALGASGYYFLRGNPFNAIYFMLFAIWISERIKTK